MDPQTICRLAEGDVAFWRGLPAEHLRRAELPSCLGPVIGTDLRSFVLGTYRVERHEASGGARVDVYGWWGDDRVAVVDAWLVRPPDSAELLGRLPPVERTHRYEMVERELWSVTEVPDAVVEEMVWGSRGLSAVLVRTGSAESILRVRGFEPMDANQWIDGFLRFVAIPEE